MKWSPILWCMVFGIAMGMATLLGKIPHGFELPIWAVLAIVIAVCVGRAVTKRHFLHGLLGGFAAGMVSPLIQLAFFSTYLANNAYAAETFKQLPAGMSPRIFVMIVSPCIAVLYGLAVGLLTLLVGKLAGRKTPVAA